MLTKELLEVEKRKPNVRPRYRDVEAYRDTAEAVIDCYEPGRTRGEIAEAVADLETHDTFKLVRALSDLIDRRATFEERSPAPPERLREALFDRGYVTTAAERRAALEAVGEAFGITADEVAANLWADRESEAVLTDAPDVDPGALLRQYNLSLTQTLLFDATELRFSVSDHYQAVFGRLSYLGLMYTVDPDLTVHVTGPASIVSGSRTYGTAMAKLFPTITGATEWRVSADVETEVGGEPRVYEFEVDSSEAGRFPDAGGDEDGDASESYDSDVERDFATRIDPLVDGWTVTREPTILRTGNRVMIPDFGFERERPVGGGSEGGRVGGDGDRADRNRADGDGAGGTDAFYLEVVGFWTPDYLAEKLSKVRALESAYPVVLAVNEELNCAESDFADANVDEVFFYRDRIPVKPVVDRINEIDRRAVEADLRWLSRRGIDVPDDRVVEVDALAAEHEVDPVAIRKHLASEQRGAISNGRYVPPSVLAEIGAEIEAADGTRLADVNGILERYGVGQELLETVGYEVVYTSLDQSEAEIRPREE